MITHQTGVSTFTVFSSDIVDVNEVPASSYTGKFTDLCLFSKNIAYGFHQPDKNPNCDALVQFELNHFISWEIIDQDAMYYRSGYHIRKDASAMTMCYLVGIDTVMVLNNP
jgi:hypothetical protein